MTATESSTTTLRRMLDERGVKTYHEQNYITWRDANGYQCFAFETYERPGLLRVHCNLTPEQAIAATLGDADYERRMDELLCRLTNGKWSKSRSYSVDFMVSCVDEAYEDATLGGGECELVYGENDKGIDSWFTGCGGRFAATFEKGRMVHPRFCQLCGGEAVER